MLGKEASVAAGRLVPSLIFDKCVIRDDQLIVLPDLEALRQQHLPADLSPAVVLRLVLPHEIFVQIPLNSFLNFFSNFLCFPLTYPGFRCYGKKIGHAWI